MSSTLAGDGQNHVGIDGGDGDVDDLEFLFGEAFAQENLEVAAGTKRRLR